MSTRIELVVISALMLSLPAIAASKVYPASSGDIALPENWGDVGMPTSTDNAAFNAGTYTMSGDLTFYNITIRKAGVTFDFTEDNKTLKLTKPQSDPTYGIQTSLIHYPYNVNDAVTTFKGGTVDCSGQKLNIVELGAATSHKYTFALTDGCVITNIYQNPPSDEASIFGKRITLAVNISNGAKFFAGRSRLVDSSGSTSVDVFDGGLLQFRGYFYSDYNASSTPSAHSVVDCRDEGSAVKFDSALYLGRHTVGNAIRVRDNATLAAKDITINSNASSSNNWLYVQNGATATANKILLQYGYSGVQVSNATLTVANDCYCHTSSHGHRLEVLDGGTLWVKGGLYANQNDNHVLVRDATLKIDGTTSVIGSQSASSDCSITLSGANAKITQNSGLWLMGERGTNNLFLVENGATYRPPYDYALVQGRGCTCRVTGAGTVLNGNTEAGGARLLYVVKEPAPGTVSPCTNCVFEVLDGAVARADRLYVHGVNSSVIVSNATLSVCSEESGGTSGYGLWVGRGKDAGCNLVLQGTTPAIRCPKTGTGGRDMIIQGKSKIRFEIPREGYAAGHAAIEADALNVSTATTLGFEIDCAEWAAETGMPKTELVLLRLTGSDFNEDARKWFDALEFDLPDGVTCFRRGREIVLSRKSTLGMMLILR